MVAFLTVHKMTKRQPAKKATGAFMAVANRHIYLIIIIIIINIITIIIIIMGNPCQRREGEVESF